MRRRLGWLGWLLLSANCWAQFTVVTGTVIDPNALPYAGGTISAKLISSGSPTLSGFAYTPPTQPTGLSSSGAFTMRLGDNTQLLPGGSQWSFTVCSGAGTVQPAEGKGPVCFTVGPLTISGAAQDITTQLQAAALTLSTNSPNPPSTTVAGLPTNPPVGTLRQVTDATVQGNCAVGGGTLLSLCRWNGTIWQSIGDGGGVFANSGIVSTGPTGGTFNLYLGTGTTNGVTTTTGNNNLCINASNLECFFSITSGSSNIAIGRSSLFSLTTGSFNTTLGNNLGGVVTGSNNTAVGNQANSGGGDVSKVSAFGNQALQSNQATEASAFGNQSQNVNTTGLNESFGSLSLLSNTTGTNNDAFGADTLRDNVAGNHNVAMGARALQSNNGGNDNVAIGQVAGYTGTPANANVTGNFNTWIGSGTGPGSTTQFSNQTVLGASATATCNSCVVLGRSSDQTQIGSGLATSSGNVLISSTAPSIAAAGCGGSGASIVANNGPSSFAINVGAAPTSGGCTVTLPTAATDWVCTCRDRTTKSTTVSSCEQNNVLPSTTSAMLVIYSDVAVASAPVASDVLRVSCFAY